MNALAQHGRAPTRPARFDPSSQHRRSMIAKIQVARQQLRMEEDDYRQILFDATGEISLKVLNEAQLTKVIAALKSKGFQATSKGGRPAAQHPMARKARALWISLHQLGVIHNPSEHALEAFAKRQLKCEQLVWARQSDAFRLIEALKDMGRRAGWMMHNPLTQKPLGPVELQSSLCQAILAQLKAVGEAPEGWGLHDAMWKLCGIENAREQAWTAEDYQHLAAALGRKLNQAGGPQQ